MSVSATTTTTEVLVMGSELVYAEDLEAGDRFLSPHDQDVVLIVTNVRTQTYRQCVSLTTGYLFHVRWSTQVRRLSTVTEVVVR